MELTKIDKDLLVQELIIWGVFGVKDGIVYRYKKQGHRTGIYKSCKKEILKKRTPITYKKFKSFGYETSHIAALCYGVQPGIELIHHHNEIHSDNSKDNLFLGPDDGSHTKYHHIDKKLPDETRRKISESKKGEKNYNFGKFGKDHHRSKAILQFTKDRKFIAEFGSIMEAERITGIHNGNITQCCKGKRKTAGNYFWRHKNVK